MPDTILRLLGNGNSFVSGQEISSSLGISRAGVWKKIQNLRDKGFNIEAIPSKGYRLVSPPDLSRDFLLSRVQGDFWKQIIVQDTVESTNELAISLASNGSIGPGTAIIADRQTRGKGRLGRIWQSPGGVNIYMSMVIRPELEPKDMTMLTVLAAVAAAESLRDVCNIPVLIKWPNDLVIEDRKLGGILTEVRADPDCVHLAVIGIGINLNMQERDFPADISRTAVSVRQLTGLLHSRNELIIKLLRNIERWQGILNTSGKGALLDAWKDKSSTLGRKVMAMIGQMTIEGIAQDIDESGMLVLRTRDGGYRKISSGDITFLR